MTTKTRYTLCQTPKATRGGGGCRGEPQRSSRYVSYGSSLVQGRRQSSMPWWCSTPHLLQWQAHRTAEGVETKRIGADMAQLVLCQNQSLLLAPDQPGQRGGGHQGLAAVRPASSRSAATAGVARACAAAATAPQVGGAAGPGRAGPAGGEQAADGGAAACRPGHS